MNLTVSYRGFDGSIIHDAVDQLFHGKILGISDFVIYHGDTPEEAETIFRQSVDEYIEHFQSRGEKLPEPFASFPGALPHELKVQAALYAQQHEVDPEDVLQTALADFLARAA